MMTTEANQPVEILLVEDNPGDVRLTQKGLEQGQGNLHVVNNGVEAMAYLRHEGEYADVPPPELVLLDLDMPKMDGREVLRQIKSDPDLKRIPVIVLTSSNADVDIAESYDLHANAYLTKPVDHGELLDVVRGIEEFWFEVVKYPPRPNSRSD